MVGIQLDSDRCTLSGSAPQSRAGLLNPDLACISFGIGNTRLGSRTLPLAVDVCTWWRAVHRLAFDGGVSTAVRPSR